MNRALCLLLAACADPQPLELFDSGPDLDVVVEPGKLEIVTGPGGAEPVQFTATATFSDGTQAVLEAAEWRLSNRSVGTLDEQGLFTPTSVTGGRTWVSAEVDGVLGSAELLVRYEETIEVGEVNADAFSGPTESSTGAWLYPADGVNLPRNVPSLRFQWNAVPGATYELDFASDVTAIRILTDQPEYTADADVWARIAATNAGGRVKAILRTAVDGKVLEEPPRTFEVNRLDARGSILYWSTTKQGLVEIPFGGTAKDWWTAAQSGRCVGCHSVSTDGKVAFTYDGGNGPMGVRTFEGAADVVAYPTDPAQPSTLRGNFSAFSPDGELLLVAYLGKLFLVNADTGAYLRDVIADGQSTHPSWSPDGSRVAFVRQTNRTPEVNGDWYNTVPGSEIVIMDAVGTDVNGLPMFGPWRVLVSAPSAVNVYYPTFSPDGAWVAFNQSAQDMVSDPDAALWVIDADGKLDPIRLAAADGDPSAWDACVYGQDPVDPTLPLKGMFNSWPRWAPLPDDDVLWIAFSSSRAYGNVVTCRPQIWVAAFDPKRAKDGVDPSWPAFWLPGQDVTDGNHIPVWMKE